MPKRKFKESDYMKNNYPGPQDVVKTPNMGPPRSDSGGMKHPGFYDGRDNPSSFIGSLGRGDKLTGPSKIAPAWSPNMDPQDAQKAADNALKNMQ